MPEETDKNIRIPVPGEEGKHTDCKVRTIVVSKKDGIKGLYCVTHRNIITYIFAKSKSWTMAKTKKWVKDHAKDTKSITEVSLDQQEEFMKLVVAKFDGTVEEYLPNSPSFDLTEDIEECTMGYEKAKETEKPEKVEEVAEKKESVESNESIEIVKLDKAKHLVYGVFLVPEKADWDGDVISEKDIEKVAHGFVADYRTIDEMHKNIITADIVESAIAWTDGLEYHGKKLTKGTWFGAIKVLDSKVWDKVESGEYKAFSVRIAGTREPIEGEDNEEA